MAVTRDQKLRSYCLFIIVLLVIAEVALAQSTGWVLWGNEERKTQYASGVIRTFEHWRVVDAFEKFAECKKIAVVKVDRGMEILKGGARGPFTDNSVVSFSYFNKLTEEEQKKSEETLLDLSKDDKKAIENIKRLGPVQTIWGTEKYLCLPGGTDPRPREKE